MGTDTESAQPLAPGRTSTARVVGIMAVVAIVAAGLVVAWARIGQSRPGASRTSLAEERPAEMEGGFPPGEVPAEVAAAADLPVVGAAVVSDVPDEIMQTCDDLGGLTWDEGHPEVESAVATPDAVHVVLRGRGSMGMGEEFGGPGGEPAERFRMRCTAYFDGGWHTQGGEFEPIFEGDGPLPPNGVNGMYCCDADGFSTVSAGVTPPDGTSWVLQERGEWYLGYPVGDRTSVQVMWKFSEGRFSSGPPSSRVLFVDDGGQIIGEELVGGSF